MNNIYQVSVTYVHEQDRLLMRINTQAGSEMRLWLTRRLTLAMLPAFKDHAGDQLKRSLSPAGGETPADPAAPLEARRQQLLESFKREAAAYAGDFKTPYKEPAAASPIESAPLLVTEVVISLQGSGQLQLKLSQKLDGASRDIELAMSPQLTQGVLHLLHQGVQLSGWLQAPPRAAPETAEDPMDALAATPPPGYLN